METNFDKEHFDMKTSHKHNAVENKEKFKDSDTKNDIDKKGKQLLSKNRCLLSAEEFTKDDEPWEIEEDSDCEVDSDVSPSCKVLILDNERKILVPHKKLKRLSDEDKLKGLETEGESNLPTAKKLESLNITELIGFHLGKDLILKDLKISNELPKPHVSVDIDDGNLKMKQEEEVDLLLDFYNKSYLNELSVKRVSKEENKTNKGVKVITLNERDIIKDLLNSINEISEDSNSSSGQSECFEEDPDFVNADILYNIDLNNHLKQMTLLTEKISKTPNDPSLLDECMQLTQIPQIESIKKTFTAEERQNFANGDSEWEYEIDKEDWNKIMVKRAAIFTAHAGFNIANEESLYVLADVAINYIKKLAKIVKKNFDIPSKSSFSDIFDPLTCSLQEIGVKDGIVELFKHYENDIFGKRNKLMKKCQHLQKIIDQFVERLFLDPKIKNKYTKDKLEEENSCEKFMKIDEKVFQQEKMTESETHKTKIQSMVEEIKLDSLSSTEKTRFTNSKLNEQQIEPIYVDNTDNEGKMDIDSNNFEKVKIAFIDDSIISINDRKINSNKKRIDSVIGDKSDIDLLQPLEITLARIKGKTSNTEKEYSSFIDLEKQKILNCDQNLFDSFNKLPAKPPVSRTLLDEADIFKEFNDDFEVFKAKSLTKKNISTRNLPFTQFHQNVANDSLPPTHTVLHANTNSKQASSANKNFTF